MATVLDENLAVYEQTFGAAGNTGVKFTANDTWVKPQGARLVLVVCVGGGGGGGGGVQNASARGGGGGGGGAAVTWLVVPANILPDSAPVTVGAGGAGGAPGSIGSDGGESIFGTVTFPGTASRPCIVAEGGLAGSAGAALGTTRGGDGGGFMKAATTADAVSGQGAREDTVDFLAHASEWGGASGGGNGNGSIGFDRVGGPSIYGGPGGGAGGRNTAGNTDGGRGGRNLEYALTGLGARGDGAGGSGAAGGNGATTVAPFCGGGGGGGGGSTGAGGFAGGIGGPGAGGGGGGSCVSGTAGAGGKGGDGYVLVAVIY